MEELLQEILSTLETDPGSLRSDQLMEEFFWRGIGELDANKASQISKFSKSASTYARRVFSSVPTSEDMWRVWYAGQLQGIAGLFRLMHGRQIVLEGIEELHNSSDAKLILNVLAKEDTEVNDLMRLTSFDENKLSRLIKLMSINNLVDTYKEVQKRLVGITPHGRVFLGEMK